ncbi:Major facilitator superfamily domain general substrate transporter [Penicillium coprophilum]|uniref:Major facilitator superfamily domain general substrate transporter n=1 Tax=Penicillium coprophilum TaxID=36646 RepID=UPI002389FFCD|nr:Major facilitator superfamily domain general substrate transporter [Penicillium coprophilum]KAJ5158684.1 Major facilitator superfamily domain general substrate transporter [Penicillium coprophilum]
MSILKLVEDRPTPSAVYNWRIYLLAAVASCTSCMIGYDSAFIGTTLSLDSFKSEFRFAEMSDSTRNLISANIVSCYQAGAFFGAFFAYPIGHFWGRRIGLLAAGLVFTLGAGIMVGVNGDRGLGLLYGGRVLAGLGVGAGSNITPIYISELSPPAIRGRLVGVYELGWQIGGLVGFWINFGVDETMEPSHKQWLIPFAVQLIPSGLLLIGCWFIRESPRWLFGRGRREDAIKNLCWIRQLPEDDIYMIEEIGAIDQALEEQRRSIGIGFWKPFKAAGTNKKVMWRLFLGSALFFWQNGSGINAINYYSPTVFKSIGVKGTNTSLFTTGIFGVVKTVVTFIWLLWLIDHVGRRNLLLIGAAGGSVCLWVVGAYIKVAKPENNKSDTLSGGGIAAMFFFYLWTVFYTPTWNGTPWVLNSEMFDPNMRSLAQACAAASNWLWNFLISRFTPQMFTAMGYGVYFFFASMMMISIVFVFFLVPETKGIPLESMDQLFDIKPVRHAHGKMVVQLRENEEMFRHDVEAAGIDVGKVQPEQIEDTADQPKYA